MAYNKGQTEIKFEIKRSIGVLSESKSGWTTELNLVSWNDKEPKYDIRAWSPDHDKMGKGITLTPEECSKLYELLGKTSASDCAEDIPF